MKKSLLSLMLAISAILVFPFQSYAQDNLDDDGEEIVIGDETVNGNGHGRTLVPVRAMLFRTFGCIEVEFFSNIGEVTISLTNFTTGSFSTIVVDSQIGSVVVPFAPSSGLWQISFHLEGGGTSYSGTFIL